MLLDAKKTQIMIEKYFIKLFLSLDGDYRYIFFWFTFFLAIQRPKHFHKICCFDSVKKFGNIIV